MRILYLRALRVLPKRVARKLLFCPAIIFCDFFISKVSKEFLFLFMNKDIDPGLIGISISYVMMLPGMFQWSMRQTAEVSNIVSNNFISCNFTYFQRDAFLAIRAKQTETKLGLLYP